VGRDGVSSRIQRRKPNALCLQPFVYVRCAHGRPRLCGEWDGKKGNKLVFFCSELPAGLGVRLLNVEENLCGVMSWKL
jgi:hypothetical protein